MKLYDTGHTRLFQTNSSRLNTARPRPVRDFPVRLSPAFPLSCTKLGRICVVDRVVERVVGRGVVVVVVDRAVEDVLNDDDL